MEGIYRSRPRKSERLSEQEFLAFETWLSRQPTRYDAHNSIGISEPTLTAVQLKKGQGSPLTIAKIRNVLTVAKP